MKRFAVFIDGNNFYYGLRKLYGKDKSLKNFNFKKFADLRKKVERLLEYFIIMLNLISQLILKNMKAKKNSLRD